MQPAFSTVKALRDTQSSWLRARFGVVMERLGYELRGVSCLALEECPHPKNRLFLPARLAS